MQRDTEGSSDKFLIFNRIRYTIKRVILTDTVISLTVTSDSAYGIIRVGGVWFKFVWLLIGLLMLDIECIHDGLFDG